MFEQKPTPAGSGHAGAGYSYPGDLAQFVRDRWRNVPELPGGADPLPDAAALEASPPSPVLIHSPASREVEGSGVTHRSPGQIGVGQVV